MSNPNQTPSRRPAGAENNRPPMRDRGDPRLELARLQRELAVARRMLHRAEKAAGQPLTRFIRLPHYGKLQHRPLILGFSPTQDARSSTAFDDPYGDALCELLGLADFLHLTCNFKLRNLITHPAGDLPHERRGRDAQGYALRLMHEQGVFKDRVVVLVGHDIRRAVGCPAAPAPDYIGPLDAPGIQGASIVCVMPDPTHAGSWRRERRSGLWSFAAFCMAASRLPVADPVKAAVQAAMGTAAPDVWSELRLPPFASFGQATRGHEVWRELIKAGLAAPANLTRGCWLPLGRPGDGYVFYGTGGYAVMVPAAGAAATVTVYDHDGAVLHSYRGQNGECRREAEVFMFEARGWDYPFRALDRRLDGLRGR